MMRPKTIDPAARFQPITGAAKITGLSRNFIREGCKAGTIPHIKVGSDFRVDMPRWFEQLEGGSET